MQQGQSVAAAAGQALPGGGRRLQRGQALRRLQGHSSGLAAGRTLRGHGGRAGGPRSCVCVCVCVCVSE